MTRDEAIQVFRSHFSTSKKGWWEVIVDSLSELGVLKLDEPIEPNQVFFSAMGDTPMTQRDVGKILAIINACGLKLVEKGDD
jgi:hypothetical protein